MCSTCPQPRAVQQEGTTTQQPRPASSTTERCFRLFTRLLASLSQSCRWQCLHGGLSVILVAGSYGGRCFLLCDSPRCMRCRGCRLSKLSEAYTPVVGLFTGLQNAITIFLLLHQILPNKILSFSRVSAEQNGEFWQGLFEEKCKILHILKWGKIINFALHFLCVEIIMFYWFVQNVPFSDAFVQYFAHGNIQSNPLQSQ